MSIDTFSYELDMDWLYPESERVNLEHLDWKLVAMSYLQEVDTSRHYCG